MCNELECAIQSAVDLININITRDVQESKSRLKSFCGVQVTSQVFVLFISNSSFS